MRQSEMYAQEQSHGRRLSFPNIEAAQARFAAAPPLLRHALAAAVGLSAAGLAALVPPELGWRVLLLAFPAVGIAAGLGGVRTGLTASVSAALVALVLLPHSSHTRAIEWTTDPLFLVTLSLVGLIVGRLADSLRAALQRLEEEKLAANEFAAALHLRLTLAEQEIERLRDSSAGADAAAGQEDVLEHEQAVIDALRQPREAGPPPPH